MRFGTRRPTCRLQQEATQGIDAKTDKPKPPFPKQKQPMPGLTASMQPVPDHGEKTYKGSGRLAGKKAVITWGDSGIEGGCDRLCPGRCRRAHFLSVRR